MSRGTERVERKLAAIFCADVADYSRLMHADETGTIRRLTAHRAIMDGLIDQHGGRIANTAGDSVLAEFPSVVDAVECAVAAQGKLGEANAGVPENGALRFRIGIHVGDVMVRGGDLLGDGVNVAARVQSLADPGGVWISGRAHDEVEGRIDYSFEDRGEQQVKNIARPVRVYALAGAAPSRSEAKRLPLPDKPSIAVLPFTNISGDPDQEYFCDGLVEDIITALARFKVLFVIARNSTFTYKGKAVDIRQVGRDLGVRYVLEGSVRKAGNRLRITGQLIEAETGNHLWADRFDGSLEDVFTLQDHITENVIATIEPQLRQAEITRAKAKRPENLTAYDRYLQALSRVYLTDRQSIADARRLLDEAMHLDPDYAACYALAAQCHVYELNQGWTDDVVRSAARGAELARGAIARERDDPTALWMAAHALAYCANDYDLSLALFDKALKLNPSSAWAHCWAGWTQAQAGFPETAIERLRAALRLSPLDSLMFLFQSGLALAFTMNGEHEQAVAWARKAIEHQPTWTASYRPLIASLMHLGRSDEAHSAAQALLRMQPNYKIAWSARVYRESAGKSLIIDGLRKAGLPE